ncbi:hypothetical protein UB23_05230 [Pseudomonas sp. ES3-33]|nr:hypothetical protein UB23_05230 [Pseudomonas sp. ES3-33]
MQAPFKARRGCWRDAKKARQYTAPRFGKHPPEVIRWSHRMQASSKAGLTSKSSHGFDAIFSILELIGHLSGSPLKWHPDCRVGHSNSVFFAR